MQRLLNMSSYSRAINNATKEAVINKKLINDAAKQKHGINAIIDQELKIVERTHCVSRRFEFGSSNLRITVSKPDYDGNNGGLNESEIEVLTESMENTIFQIHQNNVDNDIENVDNNNNNNDHMIDDDEYDLNSIFSQIEEDGEIEGEPDYGYDHCNNWMCYQCQYINPIKFENITHSNKKCINCGSNGWPTKQEMDEMIKDSNIRYGEYFKKIICNQKNK